MAAPVIPVDHNPDALAALALVPPAAPPAPAVPPAPAAPPAPVAVVEGEQVAPALQAEVCSFEFSFPSFSLLVGGQVFYRLYYVWCVRSWLFVIGRQVLFPMFGRLFDRILLVGRTFDCF